MVIIIRGIEIIVMRIGIRVQIIRKAILIVIRISISFVIVIVIVII